MIYADFTPLVAASVILLVLQIALMLGYIRLPTPPFARAVERRDGNDLARIPRKAASSCGCCSSIRL